MILNHSPDVLRDYLLICDRQIKWGREQHDEGHVAFYLDAKAEAITSLKEQGCHEEEAVQ